MVAPEGRGRFGVETAYEFVGARQRIFVYAERGLKAVEVTLGVEIEKVRYDSFGRRGVAVGLAAFELQQKTVAEVDGPYSGRFQIPYGLENATHLLVVGLPPIGHGYVGGYVGQTPRHVAVAVEVAYYICRRVHVVLAELALGGQAPHQCLAHALALVGSYARRLHMPAVGVGVRCAQIERRVVVVAVVGALQLLRTLLVAFLVAVFALVRLACLERRIVVELPPDLVLEFRFRHFEHAPQRNALRIETLLKAELLLQAEAVALC